MSLKKVITVSILHKTLVHGRQAGRQAGKKQADTITSCYSFFLSSSSSLRIASGVSSLIDPIRVECKTSRSLLWRVLLMLFEYSVVEGHQWGRSSKVYRTPPLYLLPLLTRRWLTYIIRRSTKRLRALARLWGSASLN